MKRTRECLESGFLRYRVAASKTVFRIGRALKDDSRGQGTTEYAILVGVLVVIAIVAVIAFKGNIETLWNNIAESIMQL